MDTDKLFLAFRYFGSVKVVMQKEEVLHHKSDILHHSLIKLVELKLSSVRTT